MGLNTQEHIDLMSQFEKEYRGLRLDREDKSMWPKQRVYQNGETNELFLAYRRGYAMSKCIYQSSTPPPATPAGGTGERA